jgi:hypothetical protein
LYRTVPCGAVSLKPKKSRPVITGTGKAGRRRAASSLVRYGAVRARTDRYGAVLLKLKKSRTVIAGTGKAGKAGSLVR